MKKCLVTFLALALMSTTAYANTDATSSASSTGWEAPATTTPVAPKPVTPSRPTTTTRPATTTTTNVSMPKIVAVSDVENPDGYVLYVVVNGDNLSKIAIKYDTTWQEIASLNKITHRPNLIWPGEVFFIPGTEGTVGEKTEPVTEEVTKEPNLEVTMEIETPATDKETEKVDEVEEVKEEEKVEETPEITAKGDLIDGVYVGFDSNYSKSDATDDWDYFVIVEVKNGKISDVTWDAKNETESTYGKYELSTMGEYGMLERSELGLSWAEQADTVTTYLVNLGSLDTFEVDEETRKLVSVQGVDTTASVSIKVTDFVDLAGQAIDKAEGNLPATADVDTISSASLTVDADTLIKGLSTEGNWLVAGIGDIVVEEPIKIEGTFHSKNDPEADVYRKFTMSNHVYDEEGNRDRDKEEIYVLTANGGIVVDSPNTTIVNSVIVGDILVNSEGFKMSNVTLLGTLEFASQEARDSASFSNFNLPYSWVTPQASENYQDGTYTGKVEGESFNDVVKVVIRHGNIAKVDYNPLKVEDGVETEIGKKELDAEGNYSLGEDAIATWTEQAKVLEDYVISGGNLEVDAISGASIGVEGFLEATQEALNKAK